MGGRDSVKTMCNTVAPFSMDGNISVADCVLVSSLLKLTAVSKIGIVAEYLVHHN